MLFFGYPIIQEAELARKNRDGHVMGKVKQYELSVRLFNEFDRIVNVTDEWNPPNTEPNVCKVIAQFTFVPIIFSIS